MRWRWLIGIAAALVLLIIVAAYVFVSLYDFNHLKPQIAQAVHKATGRTLTIDGDIDFKLGLTPALTVNDIRFQNAPWGSKPMMATIQHVDLQVAILPLLRKTIEIRQFRLVQPDILIETNTSGQSNVEFSPPEDTGTPETETPETDQKPLELPALALQNVKLVQGNLTYRDGQTDRTHTVVLDQLTVRAPTPDSSTELALNGTYNQVAFNLKGTVGALADLTATDTPWPLQVTATVGDNTLTIDGTVQAPLSQRALNLDVTVQASDMQSLEQIAETTMPLHDPIDIAAHVATPAPQTYRLSDLKVALGDNTLAGTMAVRLVAPRPQVTAKLSSLRLDLRPFMAQKETPDAAPAPPTTGKREKVFPAEPLPLAGLKQADADVNLAIKQLLLPQAAFNDLQVTAKLNEGHLEVKPVKAVIGGGPLTANLDLRPEGQAAAVKTALTMDQFDIGRMLKDLAITDLIEGTIDVDIDLQGRGTSVAGVMAGLSGKSHITMGAGHLNNKYINFLGDISTNLLRLINPFDKKAHHTTINCFVNRIEIKDGLADVRALVFDTDQVSLIGNGSVNLKTEKLDIALKPHAKKGAGIGGIAQGTASVGELLKPFKVGGTLAQPALAIDPVAAAAMAGKVAGGVATFGTAGIASALLSGSAGNQNPCVAALETDAQGESGAKTAPGRAGEAATKGIHKGVEEGGKALKKLFNQ